MSGGGRAQRTVLGVHERVEVPDEPAYHVGIAEDHTDFEVVGERPIREVRTAEQRDLLVRGDDLRVQRGNRATGPRPVRPDPERGQRAEHLKGRGGCAAQRAAVLDGALQDQIDLDPRLAALTSSRVTSATPNAAKLTTSSDVRLARITSMMTELVSRTGTSSLCGPLTTMSVLRRWVSPCIRDAVSSASASAEPGGGGSAADQAAMSLAARAPMTAPVLAWVSSPRIAGCGAGCPRRICAHARTWTSGSSRASAAITAGRSLTGRPGIRCPDR